MRYGSEHKAKLLDITSTALSCNAIVSDASAVVTLGLEQLSHEISIFTEYMAMDEDGTNPAIIKSVGKGLAERARALSALISTRMAIEWSPGLTGEDTEFSFEDCRGTPGIPDDAIDAAIAARDAGSVEP